jgi:hypothetical protein
VVLPIGPSTCLQHSLGKGSLFLSTLLSLVLERAQRNSPVGSGRDEESAAGSIEVVVTTSPISSCAPSPSLPLDRVSEYVSLLLMGEAVPGDGLLWPLTLVAYCALLPTLWSLVNNIGRSSDGSVGEETVKIVVDHAMRVKSTGASKRATVEFVGRLILVRSFVIYSFQANPNLMSRLTAQNGTGVYRFVQV